MLSRHPFFFFSANVPEVRRDQALQPIGQKPGELGSPEGRKIRALQSHLQNVRHGIARKLLALRNGRCSSALGQKKRCCMIEQIISLPDI